MNHLALILTASVTLISSAACADELVSTNTVHIGDKVVDLPKVIKSGSGDVCVSYIKQIQKDNSSGKYQYDTGEYCGHKVKVKNEVMPSGLETVRWEPTDDGKAGVHIITFLN